MISVFILASIIGLAIISVYSIYQITDAIRALRYSKIWLSSGLNFILGTLIYLFLILAYFEGYLQEYGWVFFFYPFVTALVSIYLIHNAVREPR